MNFSTESLIEEYHLPKEPLKLKKRLGEIIKVLSKSSHPLNVEKVSFFQNWMDGITENSKPIHTKPVVTNKPLPPVNGKKRYL